MLRLLDLPDYTFETWHIVVGVILGIVGAILTLVYGLMRKGLNRLVLPLNRMPIVRNTLGGLLLGLLGMALPLTLFLGSGGLVVVNNGQVQAKLALPVAGLMCAAPLEQVVVWEKEVNQAAHDLGATLDHPFMALSFIALPVIPKLKLTDQGLVDVESFTHVPLFL